MSKRFSWVTNIALDRSLLSKFAVGGRSRWRIENETFNTLKNQGYHFEHNYGHGKQNLSTVLMLLMFLAFMVDQVQQACCPLFAAVLVLEQATIKFGMIEKTRKPSAFFVCIGGYQDFNPHTQTRVSSERQATPQSTPTQAKNATPY